MGSSPRSYVFTSLTGRIGVHCTKVWHKTYPICDAPLSRSAGPAQLRPVTEITLPQPFLCVNRRPFWHDFGSGVKSIRYSPVADPGEGPTRAARPPPPHPYFYLVSFWWWRKICPVKCDSELSRNNRSAFDLALVVHTSLIVTVL